VGAEGLSGGQSLDQQPYPALAVAGPGVNLGGDAGVRRVVDRRRTVVDSDLAPDDLVALAYLLRHPRVRVLAVTVPTTGLVTCPVGLDLLADLTVAVRVPPVPVACGTTPRGRHGKPFPAAWSLGATTDSGLEPDASSASVPLTSPGLAHRLIGQLAAEHRGSRWWRWGR